MVLGYQDINKNLKNQQQPSFNAKKNVLTRPIEEVQTAIESGVDTFISDPNENNKKKKARKRAIAASSTVLVLGTLTLLLNPRSSGKFGERLKKAQETLGIKIKQTETGFLKKSFLKLWKNISSFTEKSGNVYFNLNSGKDWLVDSFCTNTNKEYPKFLKQRPILCKFTEKLDKFFVKIFKTPHETITKWFDNISKNTVISKYRRSLKEMKTLEISLKSYRESLPKEKRILLDRKLKEIAKIKGEFGEESVLIRLKKQENIMADLKDLFAQKVDILVTDIKGLFGKKVHKKDSGFRKNITSFWAKDILESRKATVQEDGAKLVERLFGKNGKKGLYDEVVEIVSENLDEKQAHALKIELQNASKKLNQANVSECFEYFDKKRDLQLGGAPTDILTQIFGIGLCGIAVANADKEDRWSKLFTNGVPIITGLLSSLVFSAKLFSGAKSILYGAAVSGLTTGVCSFINKHVFGRDEDENDEKETQLSKEAQNV